MLEAVYPIQFAPIDVEQPWGGGLLEDRFHRDRATAAMAVAETYELVQQPDHVSIVENGPLQGTALGDLVARGGEAFLGTEAPHIRSFPFTLKYIDAGRNLPLQVISDVQTTVETTSVAAVQVWYVAAARNGAQMIAGIKPNCTQQQFLNALHSANVTEFLQLFPSQPGDAYLIPAGRVYSIGQGNLLLSYQQNCARPSTIGEWQGELSGGHNVGIEDPDALQRVHFHDRRLARIRGESSVVNRNRKIPLLSGAALFNLDELRLVEELHDYTNGSTLHVLTIVDGAVDVSVKQNTVRLEQGRTCCIPAVAGYYAIIPRSSTARILKAYLQKN